MTKKGYFDDWVPQIEEPGVLDTYLSGLKQSFMSDDPHFNGDAWQNYTEHLEKHFDRLDQFLGEPEFLLQNLVLGNVQSGKTGHLMSSMAWAYDNEFDLVILLNGNKNTLNAQTKKRLQKSVLNKRVWLYAVPTEAAPAFTEVSETLIKRIKDRKGNPGGSPMPVAVLIKNGSRIDALRTSLERLFLNSPSRPLRVMVLDDEADQASPDATEGSKNRSAANARKSVNKALVNLSNSVHGKVIYLLYTATPQALMVQSRNSLVQPRYCSVVPSGPSYFGLEDAFNTPKFFSAQEDLANAEESGTPEERDFAVLEKAFVEFLVKAWAHNELVHEFHDYGTCHRKSVQMIIHPSGNQQDHRDYAAAIESIREDLRDMITDATMRIEFMRELFEPVFESCLKELGLASRADELAKSCGNFLLTLLKDESALRVRIVNSDERLRLVNGGDEADFLPSEDSEWDVAPAWVLVGGDILGRGLTIPHLLTTFFLRNPKAPNFDSSVQQMRFCGYRRSYKTMLRVYLPREVLTTYRELLFSDQQFRLKADIWHDESRDLKEHPDPIVYETSSTSKARATRSSVMSKDVRKSKSSKDFNCLELDSVLDIQTTKVLVREIQEYLESQNFNANTLHTISPGSLEALITKIVKAYRLTAPAESLLIEEAFRRQKAKDDSCGLFVSLPDSQLDLTELRDNLESIGTRKITRAKTAWPYRSYKNQTSSYSFEEWSKGEAIEKGQVRTLIGDSERRFRKSEPDMAVLYIKPLLVTFDEIQPSALVVSVIFWLPFSDSVFLLHLGS